MNKDKSLRLFDRVWINFVPKIVDEDHEKLIDRDEYMKYSVEQVKSYLNSLPEEYTIGLSEEIDRESETGLYRTTSLCDLVVGFKPDYYLLTEFSIRPENRNGNSFTDDDCIACPTIDVIFKPTDYKAANTIVRKGLDMFFLNQADIECGTIMAYGIRNGEMISEDLKLLRKCLPRFTPLETRCNYAAGNSFATYLL